MVFLEKLTTTVTRLCSVKRELTSSSLLWLPKRSSCLEGPCSNRLGLEEAVATVLEDADVILENPEVLLEEFGSKMSPAGVITTSLATSPSDRRT